MSIPDYQTLMLPVLKLAAENEQRVPAAAAAIADQFGLGEIERDEMLPSGKQRLLHNRVHWAKFYLTKAGLVETPKRGIFKATDLGHKLVQNSPEKIDVEFLKQFASFSEFYSSSSGQSDSQQVDGTAAPANSRSTPEEQIDAASEVLNSALKTDLLGRILENSPSFFERVIVDLLVGMGYGGTHENAARRLGKSGDGGIDGIIDEDRLGLDRIYVQAKRYAPANCVGRPEIQGFVGSLVGHSASKGVFVTTSGFSKHAVEYATGLQQRIILIDGSRLTELMIEFGVGVRVSRTIEVKRLDEDFFEGLE